MDSLTPLLPSSSQDDRRRLLKVRLHARKVWRTGAGLGAAVAKLGLGVAARDAVVLGMAAYLAGVVQAPLTSAVILMEMTRDPGLVGPLMLAALLARWISGLITPEPIYHRLSRNWRLEPRAQ